MIPSFLTADDRDRVFRTIRKLAEHDISDWALTGGLAVEMHIQNGGHTPCIRALNDLDFITREFEGIPISLAGEFLFRHVHPLDPPGKTILQLIDGDTSLRVDVFRAYGATMSRTTNAELGSIAVRLISLEDLAETPVFAAETMLGLLPTAAFYSRNSLGHTGMRGLELLAETQASDLTGSNCRR